MCYFVRATVADNIDLEILRHLNEGKSADTDEDFLFGQSIAASLKTMDPQRKLFAKMKLQKVLYDAQYSPMPFAGPSTVAGSVYPPYPTYPSPSASLTEYLE